MKILLKAFFAGIFLLCSIAFADVQTTTTITNTPSSNVIAPVPNQSSTTITTVTKDNNLPSAADDQIAAGIYEKFSKSPALIGTNLKVTCLNGIVTIDGTVTAQSQADAAVEAATSIAGLGNVRSNIHVTTNPDLNKPAQVVPKY